MTSPLIGYLISQYPAPSHTFIRREVAAIRARGFRVATYSVQRPPEGLDGALNREAASTTFSALAQPLLSYVAAHLNAAATRPSRYFQTLALALRHRVPGGRAALWSLFHFAEAILIAQQMRRDGVTHLHNHFANSGATVGILAARFAGLDYSLTLHGISEFDYPAGLLLSRKIEAAKFVACVSRFGMAQAMRLTKPNQWSKLRLVRCGVDLDALPQTAERPETVPPHIICVGRLSPEKGQAGLIQALVILRDRGVSCQLTLVGDGPDQDQIRALVNECGLIEQVHFAGRLDEASTLAQIAEADILALPSFMEGLPVVLMEAMALGIPVVATRVAGIPELVEDGVSGLLFDPADWAGLADAMSRLVQDRDLRARCVREGRRRIDDRFAIDRAIEPLTRLLPRA